MLKGYVDIAGAEIRGWAAKVDEITSPVKVNFFVNGQSVGAITSDLEREDLFPALGSTRHGFQFDISSFLTLGRNKVEVKFADSGEAVEGGTYTFMNGDSGIKAFEGLDDWLFLHNDTNDVMETLLGRRTYDAETQISMCREHLARRTNCLGAGSTYACFVVPEKHVIYPSYVAPNFHVSENRPAVILNRYFERIYDTSWLYLLPQLSAATLHRQVFHKTDTHVNDNGLRIVADLICSKCDLPYPPQRSYIHGTECITGDLGAKFSIPRSEATPTISYESSKSAQCCLTVLPPNVETGQHLTGSYRFFINKAAFRQRTLLLIGTSTAERMVHHLLPSFSKIIYVWSARLAPDIVQNLRIDNVVCVMSERFLSPKMHDPEHFVGGTVGAHEEFLARAETFLRDC